jgi:hypothetical protein
MKQILYVFCGLLVLLTLISTFGGSVRVTEKFVEEEPVEEDEVSVDAAPRMMETFYQDALMTSSEEQMEEEPVDPTVNIPVGSEMDVKPAPPAAEGFRNFEKFEDFPEDARPFDLFGCRAKKAEREDEFEELFAVKQEQQPAPFAGEGVVEGFSGCMYATCGAL